LHIDIGDYIIYYSGSDAYRDNLDHDYRFLFVFGGQYFEKGLAFSTQIDYNRCIRNGIDQYICPWIAKC